MYIYACNCTEVSWRDVPALHDMIGAALDISYRTFRKRVGGQALDELAAALGYDANLHLSNDWAVSFHRSRLNGRRVYYMRWSSIEYIFTPDGCFSPRKDLLCSGK